MHSAYSIEEDGKLQRSFAANDAAQDDKAADTVIAALQARLEVIEKELVRITDLACRTDDRGQRDKGQRDNDRQGNDQQDKCWELARDLQRNAREIRAEINSRSRTRPTQD
jgi:hypothetical protein